MKIPILAMPVKRTLTNVFFEPGISPSACPAGVSSTEMGTCIIGGNHPANLNNFNCAACCAQRESLSWISPNHVVNC